jgi:hypothetical protein
MKAYLIAAALSLTAASAASAACVTTAAGRTVCRNAAGKIVAPGAAAVAPGATYVAPRAGYAAPGAAYVAPGAAVPHTAYYGAAGSSAVRTPYGAAGYNARTGNAAVAHTNANGVTTTQTSRGGEAKTYNGKGVAHGAGGTTCVKGRGSGHCN